MKLRNKPSQGEFQSTLPAWGETADDCARVLALLISIHSPRMGRDIQRERALYAGEDFNPLSPHGERHGIALVPQRAEQFQSTLPAWGETKECRRKTDEHGISIHSPRMGRDVELVHEGRLLVDFNPLSPHGERPATVWALSAREKISIHSPRMGRDRIVGRSRWASANFNPLSPHGERRRSRWSAPWPKGFQSTLPAWGETIPGILGQPNAKNFNPLSPHGERPPPGWPKPGRRRFQSTLPAWGETITRPPATSAGGFQSTLPAWGETSSSTKRRTTS